MVLLLLLFRDNFYMNVRILGIASLLLTFSSLALGGQFLGGSNSLPPKYLSVPHWKECSTSITCGSARYVCLPRVKPALCPEQSWQLLTSGHLIPDCSKGCDYFTKVKE